MAVRIGFFPDAEVEENCDSNPPVHYDGVNGWLATTGGAVTGTPASVICGNVQTANATVYIIDQVLKPAGM